MDHWPECIDIWKGASLGLGDLSLFNEVPGVTHFKKQKPLKIFFSGLK